MVCTNSYEYVVRLFLTRHHITGELIRDLSDYPSVVHFLLDKAIDARRRDGQDACDLVSARYTDHSQVAQLLLMRGLEESPHP